MNTLTVELTVPLHTGPSAPAPLTHQVMITKASSQHPPLRAAAAHAWPRMSCPGRSPGRAEPEPPSTSGPFRGERLSRSCPHFPDGVRAGVPTFQVSAPHGRTTVPTPRLSWS